MDWKDAPASRPVCFCKMISKKEIICAISAGARSLDDIKRMTFACTGSECAIMNPSGKCCEKDILEMIAFYAPLAEALHWKK